MGRMENPLTLSVFYIPTCPWIWVMDCDESEDPSLAILDTMDEEFHRKTMVAR
jgi:hypothetical protein